LENISEFHDPKFKRDILDLSNSNEGESGNHGFAKVIVNYKSHVQHQIASWTKFCLSSKL